MPFTKVFALRKAHSHSERILGDNKQTLIDLVKESAKDIFTELGYGENQRKHT
jgi:hypothetical protein